MQLCRTGCAPIGVVAATATAGSWHYPCLDDHTQSPMLMVHMASSSPQIVRYARPYRTRFRVEMALSQLTCGIRPFCIPCCGHPHHSMRPCCLRPAKQAGNGPPWHGATGLWRRLSCAVIAVLLHILTEREPPLPLECLKHWAVNFTAQCYYMPEADDALWQP